MCVETPNRAVGTADGITCACRRCGPGSARPPLLLLGHFRGTLDCWDPALVYTQAAGRDVIAFDDAGVALSTGSTPCTIRDTALDTMAFLPAVEVRHSDVPGTRCADSPRASSPHWSRAATAIWSMCTRRRDTVSCSSTTSSSRARSWASCLEAGVLGPAWWRGPCKVRRAGGTAVRARASAVTATSGAGSGLRSRSAAAEPPGPGMPGN